MTNPDELQLRDLPAPPLYRLVDDVGADVFEKTEVAGYPSTVGALFGSRELAEEFSAGASGFGMKSLAGLKPDELSDWASVEDYGVSGQEYVLVASEKGTGLFHAGDVARHALERSKEGPSFPLYIVADRNGESPLISVEEEDGTLLIAALFSSPEKAQAFRERASHLELPDSLGTIEDASGLGRHARIAQRAGADYLVVDPESGLTEAIPVEEWSR